MGLISEEVEISIGARNVKHFENLGYETPKKTNKFGKLVTDICKTIKVKVEDLTGSADIKVKVECNSCEKELEVEWYNYRKCVKENGKYYCVECAQKLYGWDKLSKALLIKNGISFEDWCIENNKQDILDRWDYELNTCKPNEIAYSTRKQFYFKCERNIHDSELRDLNNISSGRDCGCRKCGSIAQWGIDNIGENFLEKYWDYKKNVISPWEIQRGNNTKKIWIKCQEKDYHDSYDTLCLGFSRGNRCPYCINRHGKVHKLDSLGTLFPKVLEMWSDKNKKSPYDYSPMSNQEVYWKCPDKKHNDYKRRINKSNECGFRCPECQHFKGEDKISKSLSMNNIYYISQYVFSDCRYKKVLPFDFYLLDYNVCVEYQGIQHYEPVEYFGGEKAFIKQQLKDQIKRDYCKDKNIKLIEIPYWDFDNIESILQKELNL